MITIAKFRAWLQTLSLTQLIQILKDAAERAGSLSSRQERGEKLPDFPEVDKSKESTEDKQEIKSLSGKNSQGNTTSLPIDLLDQEAVVNIIFQLVYNLSLEKIVQVDNRLRDLIFSKLQDLGLLEMSKYKNHPFYILMEEYRMNNNLSYEQFEERLLREGRDAGLDSKRIAKIVRGQSLPNDRELIWIGVFIKKPDGSLYNHDELVALRDVDFNLDSKTTEVGIYKENFTPEILSHDEGNQKEYLHNFEFNGLDEETNNNEHNRNFERNGK